MPSFNDLTAPFSFGGGGGGGGGGSSDPVTKKMDRDNSATQQALDNALNNDNSWTRAETNSHAASQSSSAANGWPSSNTGSIGGCTGCHDGRFDTHY